MPKGWLHGDIEISGTSTPWVSGGTGVEPCVEHFHFHFHTPPPTVYI
jgi:hypothetical protein